MALEMIRIDDRLIHGQVVVGWCPTLQPDRLLLCDDEIASSEWERQIYEDAAMDYKVSVCSLKETVAAISSGEFENEKVMMIVSSPEIVVELVKSGVPVTKVVVGGMHYQSGKRKLLDFVFIDDNDVANFSYLASHNVLLEGRDVPTCKPIDIAAKLGLH